MFDNLGKVGLSTSLLTGIGIAVLVPVIAPVLGTVLRPVARSVVGTGILMYRQISESVSGGFSELVAEARQELEHSRITTNAPAESGRSMSS